MLFLATNITPVGDATSFVTILPTSIIPNTTVQAASTTNPVSSSTALPSEPMLPVGAKAGIGVAIPVAALIVLTLGFFKFCWHRKRQNKALQADTVALSGEDQPYLHQKGELEAEERRRYEMHGEHVQYELEGDNEMHEMAARVDQIPSNRPELRGEEHCKELSDETVAA